MKNEKIETIWKEYDNTLESKTIHGSKSIVNKRIKGKMGWLKFQSIYGIIITPIIFLGVLLPLALQSKPDNMLYCGIITSGLIFIYYLYHSIKSLILLDKIRPANSTILENKKNVLNIRDFVIRYSKRRTYVIPFFIIGIALIIGENIHIKEPITITVMIVSIIALMLWSKYKTKLYFIDRIKELELEFEELKEFNN